MINQVSKSQAIIEFKKMFDIGNNQSMYNDDSFLINKSDYTRQQVVSKPVSYTHLRAHET